MPPGTSNLEPGTWNLEPGTDGPALHALIKDLYPICRSITGNGVRQTLRRLQQEVPLEIREIPSGTPVFDWTIPEEWNIRDAWIKDSAGRRIVDFRRLNLHVMSYSEPVHRCMTLDELRPHLHTLPEHPDWIPYRTSYYRRTWGFCLSQRQLESLTPGEYEVCIDSTLEPGSLTYGELRIEGETVDTVLFSCHCCHPALCNDNLSGLAVSTALAQQILQQERRRYSYRFVWVPGTIGSIAWLALNERLLPRIKHGLVLTCVGDPGPFTYKRSRRGDTTVDRVVPYVLRSAGQDYRVEDFTPYGYDERQYCSPGINLPVGCFMRTPHGQYPEYHTSADDLELVKPRALAESLSVLRQVVDVLEGDRHYRNLSPKCEPQLGRRGLYAALGGKHQGRQEEALLWVLNLSDSEHSLLDIAERSNLPFTDLVKAATLLVEHGLLRQLE